MDNIEPEILSIIIKIVIVGESSVGKTNLLIRYMKDSFDDAQRPTIGMDFFTKEIVTEQHSIKVQFWDTAGQEKYKTLASAYYKVSSGVILVYDVTSRNTFTKLDHWIKEIDLNAPLNLKMMLIGNKTDLVEDRQVSAEEGKEFAKKHDMFFWETSAKVNTNAFVHKAFEELIDECKKTILRSERAEMESEIQKIKARAPSIKMKKKPTNSSCC